MAKGLRSKGQRRNRSLLRKTVMQPIVDRRRRELAELQKRILSSANSSRNIETLSNLRKSIALNKPSYTIKSDNAKDTTAAMTDDSADDEENSELNEGDDNNDEMGENQKKEKEEEVFVGENVVVRSDSRIPTAHHRKFIIEPKKRQEKVHTRVKELVWFK